MSGWLRCQSGTFNAVCVGAPLGSEGIAFCTSTPRRCGVQCDAGELGRMIRDDLTAHVHAALHQKIA